MSPHLQVWRWHITLVASIANRVTGVASYVGMFILAAWALALASGPDAYATCMGVLGSIPGKVVLFGLTIATLFHFAGGLRHLFWDMGAGHNTKAASSTAWASIVFAVIGSILVWIVAGVMGAL